MDLDNLHLDVKEVKYVKLGDLLFESIEDVQRYLETCNVELDAKIYLTVEDIEEYSGQIEDEEELNLMKAWESEIDTLLEKYNIDATFITYRPERPFYRLNCNYKDLLGFISEYSQHYTFDDVGEYTIDYFYSKGDKFNIDYKSGDDRFIIGRVQTEEYL